MPAFTESLSLARTLARCGSVWRIALALLAAIVGAPRAQAADGEPQYYEVRQYVLDEAHNGAALDGYLSNALLPALKRAGAGPVGIFTPAENAESHNRFVIISYATPGQIAQVRDALRGDAQLAAATAELESAGADNPPYQRIHSELLVAMQSMPQAKSGDALGTPESRVYELRTYESANEGAGDRKVDMFNEGEVDIFLDCGIIPVFLGQAVMGPYAPSLTYMSAYPDEAARVKAWETFVDHPDWKQMRELPKYQGTVSKIYKHVLRPLPGSQL